LAFQLGSLTGRLHLDECHHDSRETKMPKGAKSNVKNYLI
jgi:hypothetical protein